MALQADRVLLEQVGRQAGGAAQPAPGHRSPRSDPIPPPGARTPQAARFHARDGASGPGPRNPPADGRAEGSRSLQMAGDFYIGDGQMEVRLQVGPTLGVQTHAHVEEAEAAPALLLGPVHGHVGILDQPFGGVSPGAKVAMPTEAPLSRRLPCTTTAAAAWWRGQ